MQRATLAPSVTRTARPERYDRAVDYDVIADDDNVVQAGLFVIQPEGVEAFFTPLPVDSIPGVGKVTEKRLQELGQRTAGELRGMELAALEGRFGRYGTRSLHPRREQAPLGFMRRMTSTIKRLPLISCSPLSFSSASGSTRSDEL